MEGIGEMNLNKQKVNDRDMILFNELYDEQKYSMGGIRKIESILFEDYVDLLRVGAIDPYDRQNDAPCADEIMKFVWAHPNFYAFGYAVSPQRDDYRVSIEGVACTEEYSLQDVWDFFEVFPYPDELTIQKGLLRCWYD